MLGSNSHDDYMYPPIKYLVADDAEYCVELSQSTEHRVSQSVSQFPTVREYFLDLNGTGMTSYFTGYWLNQETALKRLHSLYTIRKDGLLMAFDYYSKLNRLNYYNVIQLPKPKLFTKISSGLVFKPFMLHNIQHNQYFPEERDHLETIY